MEIYRFLGGYFMSFSELAIRGKEIVLKVGKVFSKNAPKLERGLTEFKGNSKLAKELEGIKFREPLKVDTPEFKLNSLKSNPINTRVMTKSDLAKQMASIKVNGAAVLDKSTIKNYIKTMIKNNPNFNIEELSKMLNELNPEALKKYESEIFGTLISSRNPVVPSEFLARKFNYKAELSTKFDDSSCQDKIKDLFNSITSEEQLNFAKKLTDNNVTISYLKNVIDMTSNDKVLQDIATKIKANPGYSDGDDLCYCIELAKKSPENLEKMQFLISKAGNIKDTDLIKLMNAKDLTVEKLRFKNIFKQLDKHRSGLNLPVIEGDRKATLNLRMKICQSEFNNYYQTCLKIAGGDKEKAINMLAKKVANNLGMKKIVLSFDGEALARTDKGELPWDIEKIEDEHLKQLFAINNSLFSEAGYKPGEIAGFIYPGHGSGFGNYWGNHTMGVYDFIDANFKAGDKVLVETCDFAMPSLGKSECMATAKQVIAHGHGYSYIEPKKYPIWENFWTEEQSRIFNPEELVGENEELNQLLKKHGYQRTKKADGNYWIEFSDEYLTKLGKSRENLWD